MLFETLPHGIIQYERDGSVVWANPAAAGILGLAPGEMTSADRAGQTVHEDGTPYRPDDLPGGDRPAHGQGVPGVVAGIRNARNDDVRWVRVTAVPDVRDAQDQPRRAYSVFTDITEQRRALARLQESHRLLGRLRDANVLGVAVADRGGHPGCQRRLPRHHRLHPRCTLRPGASPGTRSRPRSGHPLRGEAVGQLRRTGASRPYEKEHLHRDGHRVPVLIGGAVLDRNPLRWVKFVVDLTARQRREQERAELLAREQAARMAADAAQDRLALLLGATNLVAATGNRQELRDQLAQLTGADPGRLLRGAPADRPGDAAGRLGGPPGPGQGRDPRRAAGHRHPAGRPAAASGPDPGQRPSSSPTSAP